MDELKDTILYLESSYINMNGELTCKYKAYIIGCISYHEYNIYAIGWEPREQTSIYELSHNTTNINIWRKTHILRCLPDHILNDIYSHELIYTFNGKNISVV